MQEEVTGKSVALIVDGARMSEQVLEKAINAYLDARKNKQPKIYHGKQSLKQLARQNAGLANIEITEKNIGNPIAIYLDDIMISNPTVQAPITNGKAQISGNFDAQSVTVMATKINAASLPFGFTVKSVQR